MDTRGFLDQLLKTAKQSAGDLAGTAGIGNTADFGKGALAGGALALLLGGRRARRMATLGGLAAVGALAYRAYGDWKRQQGDAGAAVAMRDPLSLPAPEAESHSQALFKALIAAAKADGHVDDREHATIEGEFTRLGADADTRLWLQAELQKPLDPAEVAAAASSPELAAQMYMASVLVADEQNFMERTYLDELARQLKLDDGLKATLEQQACGAAG